MQVETIVNVGDCLANYVGQETGSGTQSRNGHNNAINMGDLSSSLFETICTDSGYTIHFSSFIKTLTTSIDIRSSQESLRLSQISSYWFHMGIKSCSCGTKTEERLKKA